MAKNITTYTSGFNYKISQNITKNDIMILCDNLSKEFGEGYDFEPEGITEGGIKMTNWPNKQEEMYKSLRLCYNRNWPYIKDIKNWKENNDIVFIKNNEKYNTFLKAFDNSPKWTRKELKNFQKCFENIGLYVFKSTIPTNKKMEYK